MPASGLKVASPGRRLAAGAIDAVTLGIPFFALAVGAGWLYHRRGPGYRILGLRRVDARTGGPVSIRSAVVDSAVRKAWSRSTRVLVRQMDPERHKRVETIDAEVEEARSAHAGDPDAMQRAVADVYRRHGPWPMRACLQALASSVLLFLPALWSPLNQTLPERMAGTVVVRDD